MTEFSQEVRHHCRNPKCRMKLPTPVSNPREAFCTRGCYTSFYLHRCVVCEGPMERKSEQQKLCRKSTCRNAWNGKTGFGCYATSSAVSTPHKTSIKPGTKTAVADGRPATEHWTGTWSVLRVVAGPPMTANQYHCAVIGAGEALAEADRANETHWRAAKAGKRGYRCVRSFDMSSISPAPKAPAPIAPAIIGDGLDIPAFLRRTARQPDKIAA